MLIYMVIYLSYLILEVPGKAPYEIAKHGLVVQLHW